MGTGTSLHATLQLQPRSRRDEKSGGGKIEVEMEIPPGEPPREVACRRRRQRRGGGSRWSHVRHGKNKWG